MRQNRQNAWLLSPQPNPKARLRLFCFPYAGGAAQVFRSWPAKLPSVVETVAVQPPGRGARIKEAPFTSMTTLVEAAAEALLPQLDKPFAFFGHSLGAFVSFELARFQRRKGGPRPSALFVSGARAPQLPSLKEPIHNLPDDELIEALRDLKGTPDEVLDNAELMQFMLPLLRADFEVNESYAYRDEPPLDYPITAFGGTEDEQVSRERLEGWREQTRASFTLRLLPGDHFFLHSSQELLLRELSRALGQLSEGRGP
ncbi:MAG TPA: thioesterase II family protein [Pyrinomonadaceae bacterium]|jgi:medium-chain acyl-[acyl-carrier-protein] hydrolase